MISGYRVNYKERESCYGYVCSSLDPKEVKEKLNNWLINEDWKKN